jgi:hypothetical protein
MFKQIIFLFCTFTIKLIKMLKLSVLPLVAVALFAGLANNTKKSATPKEIAPITKKVPGTPTVTNIMAGQTIVAGTITVVDDQDLGTLKVTYQLNGQWSLKEVHLYVGTADGIPVGNNGNPRIGLFPYKKTDFAIGTQFYSVTLSLGNLPADEVVVAAHSKIAFNSTNQTETGWGQGPQINDGGSWAMKFTHVFDVH